jgi:uncharacterized protein YodC (DUF2158 family)
MEQLKAEYPEGCIVHLKAGSPPLTVEWLRTDGIISVVWFAGETLCRADFHPNAIQAA